MRKTILGAALAAITLAGLVTAAGSVAATPSPTPTPITRPGGLTPQGRTVTGNAATVGDCEMAGVTCKPDRAGSCTGYSSQTTPPATIRVYVPSVAGYAYRIQTIPFETYVENVLPDEWVPSWDGDALKAGAVAVKSYAWYWITHYGGYVTGTDSSSTCFDVTDDTDFQKYKAGSATARTTQAVQQTWPVVAQRDGQVVQTSYRAYLTNAGGNEACGAGRNGTTMSQYGTQACNEANTGYKYNVILQIYYGTSLQLYTTQQLRTQHDFQYLQRSTRVTFAAGRWSIDDGYPTTLALGKAGDLPVVTTAGDGFAHIGVYRPSAGTWFLGSATGSVASTITLGGSGDTPVAAQYNGLSAPTQLAVFRPSTGTWFLQGGATVPFGAKGDVPVPGRWLSSTSDSIGVYRPSTGTWYLRGGAKVSFGVKGDIPVPADYNGDGITDVAVYRPSNHTFYVSGGAKVAWGVSGDIPVTGDFNGDGKADFAVYRPSTHTWYVQGGSAVGFGSSGATPIGTTPYHD